MSTNCAFNIKFAGIDEKISPILGGGNRGAGVAGRVTATPRAIANSL
ncbi:hypothetical protein [Phormidium sp. CCY1219]|nr:hypothetical protein [Phormidium sp. CCY1219]MEB3830178.1 hypothetical protein [Phormidium sp. CCY1219]